MWIWGSKTGGLLNDSLHLKEYGYAGRDTGKNNPDLQRVKGIGPLPEGTYTIEEPHDSAVTGPYTLRLIPSAANEMFGRASFAIHGDSIAKPGTASHGCIVVSRKMREEVWDSGDHRLRVIAI